MIGDWSRIRGGPEVRSSRLLQLGASVRVSLVVGCNGARHGIRAKARVVLMRTRGAVAACTPWGTRPYCSVLSSCHRGKWVVGVRYAVPNAPAGGACARRPRVKQVQALGVKPHRMPLIGSPSRFVTLWSGEQLTAQHLRRL